MPYEEHSILKFYFAPMEGLTGYVYRNAHNTFFHGISKYFSPFIVANQCESFRSRELNDILPENNQGIVLVPQLLTNNANDFVRASRKIESLGYHEINFNLGCPSKTVVTKHKGAGFLSNTEKLDAFFDEVFSQSSTQISVKTRIGMDHPEEFYELIEIFDKYPIKELIIHPRTQKDLYQNKPNLAIFKDALALSKNPVCYNGDIFTIRDYKAFSSSFPGVGTMMLGRGLITNPGLVQNILSGTKLEKSLLRDFHEKIYEDYQRTMSGDRNVLFKMKELWSYMISIFSNNSMYAKRIRKSQSLYEYDEAVADLFNQQDILD